MDTLKSLLDRSQAEEPVDRRRFLSMTTLGAASLLLPSFSVKAELATPGQWQFLGRLLLRFGGQVAYGIVTDSIGQWVMDLTAQQRRSVWTGIQNLVGRGYISPTGRVPIYGEGGSSTHCVYHPVHYNEPSQIDGIVPFYDFCTCECRAQLAAPTMFGLSQAAETLRQRGYDPQEIAACLVPDRQTAPPSFGRFYFSYQRPDRYVSEDGTRVAVGYAAGRTSGEVRLIAERDYSTGTRTILNRGYEVRFA